MMRGIGAGIAVLLTAGTAGAASFPCTDARRPVEQLICSAPELSRADERMGDAYDALLAAAAGQGVGDALRDRLHRGQREWLTWRDRVCEVPTGTVTPGDLSGLTGCLLAVTMDRLETLRRLTEGLPVSALIEPQPIKESNDARRYDLDVSYPALDPAVAGAAGFNSLVEQRIRRHIDSFRAAAAEAEADAPEEFRSDLMIGYDVAYASPRLVSVSFDVSTYVAGAAHGLTLHEGLHYDLGAGRPFGADAVFRPESGWREALAAHALADLRRQARQVDLELLVERAEDLADVVADLSHWRLETDMAYIVFDPYSAAPYSAGPLEVAVSYALLAPYLRPDGPLPPKR
ncbi:DUF3298 domain-containing protein [Azospirillum halopraeferens]|uniref:DUF3298 domain-containing protein n=1 Tax=Azospirillum halopraeferens TaxID=34010 RepID=UPI000685D38A|nr:lysozyme inhibitor LprI family protein [Azospirillum halopraeferens]